MDRYGVPPIPFFDGRDFRYLRGRVIASLAAPRILHWPKLLCTFIKEVDTGCASTVPIFKDRDGEG
jgi:hypothetical protein